jgi:hypothetical protein
MMKGVYGCPPGPPVWPGDAILNRTPARQRLSRDESVHMMHEAGYQMDKYQNLVRRRTGLKPAPRTAVEALFSEREARCLRSQSIVVIGDSLAAEFALRIAQLRGGRALALRGGQISASLGERVIVVSRDKWCSRHRSSSDVLHMQKKSSSALPTRGDNPEHLLLPNACQPDLVIYMYSGLHNLLHKNAVTHPACNSSVLDDKAGLEYAAGFPLCWAAFLHRLIESRGGYLGIDMFSASLSH